jgi:hypothetical protein
MGRLDGRRLHIYSQCIHDATGSVALEDCRQAETGATVRAATVVIVDALALRRLIWQIG